MDEAASEENLRSMKVDSRRYRTKFLQSEYKRGGAIILKQISGFSDYFADEHGNIYSKKTGTLKILHPFVDSKGHYLQIRLIDDSGIRRTLLVHRIIALLFVPNVNNLPEVNHKDSNPKNPSSDNLEWVTHKENIHMSYNTMSQKRYALECILMDKESRVGTFSSIKEDCDYAEEVYNANKSSLMKYRQWGYLSIIVHNIDLPQNNKVTRNRNPIEVSYKGNVLGIFKTKHAAIKYIEKEMPGYTPKNLVHNLNCKNEASYKELHFRRLQDKCVTTSLK